MEDRRNGAQGLTKGKYYIGGRWGSMERRGLLEKRDGVPHLVK